jgi:hypothetical protein
MTTDARGPEDQWPAVTVAYDFVLPSYQWMTTRLEATVGRVQSLMTFAATIALGFPVLGQAINKTISYYSIPFGLAIVFFVLLMVIGIVARDLGDTMLTSPAKLYSRSLHLSDWEFKRDAIFYAGVCFDHNAALANRKARLARCMSWLLLGETLSLLLWIARHT